MASTATILVNGLLNPAVSATDVADNATLAASTDSTITKSFAGIAITSDTVSIGAGLYDNLQQLGNVSGETSTLAAGIAKSGALLGDIASVGSVLNTVRTKTIDRIKLSPGNYRVQVEVLRDIPELAATPIQFGIYIHRL